MFDAKKGWSKGKPLALPENCLLRFAVEPSDGKTLIFVDEKLIMSGPIVDTKYLNRLYAIIDIADPNVVVRSMPYEGDPKHRRSSKSSSQVAKRKTTFSTVKPASTRMLPRWSLCVAWRGAMTRADVVAGING